MSKAASNAAPSNAAPSNATASNAGLNKVAVNKAAVNKAAPGTAQLSENPSLESLVAAVADEFLERQKRGERPDIDQYTRRYPAAAAVLRDVLTSLQVIGAGSEAHGLATVAQDALAGCLGDFRIVREAGRGGMGIVYEAEQISLGRRVALKVLPFAATLDPDRLRRFKNEAQAAAQLHHTNIVPIHFVGADRGVHFYAMQFIDGQSLAQVIADLRLQIADCRKPGGALSVSDGGRSLEFTKTAANGQPICDVPPAMCHSTARTVFTEAATRTSAHFRAVARLGVQAAQALEHAHEMGVIHRDIKPANLLLDARGNLWVTDFGLAQMHGDSRLTMTGDLVGTLRYMSPEQALGQRVEVDPRRDIYSLGATLYEIMTLEPVFSAVERRELLDQIATVEPKSPRRINPAIPVDLETVVLKALAKNRRERYGTAAELAADLQRFLEDKPVQARRPTLRQRAARWARRHVVLVRAAAVVLGLAVVGLAAATALIWRSQVETQEALARVERMQRLAESAVNDMYTEVAEKWLENEPLSDPLQRKFLLKALEYFKEFAKEARDCTQLARQTALAYKRVGVIQSKLGQHAEAEANMAEAISRFQSLTTHSNDVKHLLELATCYNAHAVVLTHTGNLKQAEQDFREARDILGRLVAIAPADSESQRVLARHRANLAALLMNAGRFPEAEKELTKALEADSRLTAQHPEVDDYRFGVALTQHSRGVLFWKTNRLAEAETAWKEAIRLNRDLSAASPRDLKYLVALVQGQGYLVALHYAAGRFQEAEKVLQQNLPLQQKLAQDYPQRVEYQEAVATTLCSMGLTQRRTGARDKAEESHRLASKLLRALLARSPKAVRCRSQLAGCCNELGNLFQETGQLEQAEPAYREAVTLLETQPEDCHQETTHRDDLSMYVNNLGYLYWQTGQPARAEPLLIRAVDLCQKLVSDFPANVAYRDKLVGMRLNLARLLKQAGKNADAEQQFRGALQQAQALASVGSKATGHKRVAERYDELGWLLWGAHRFPEAAEAFRGARTAWRKVLELEPDNPAVCHLLARFLADCPEGSVTDPAEALRLAERALALAPKPPGTLWITLGLARYRTGAWQEALAALDKAGAVSAVESCQRDFLRAMAHARLGHGNLARTCHDRAVSGMSRVWVKEDDLHQRRLEAELVLAKKAS
jgi:serine/threonine protein kinase